MCFSTNFLCHEINTQPYAVLYAVEIDTLVTNFEKNKGASETNIYSSGEKYLFCMKLFTQDLLKYEF